MRNTILLLAVLIAFAISSCTKSPGNFTYTCDCNYTLITGPHSRDTITNYTYAAGTAATSAQADCTDRQDTLISTGIKGAVCLLTKQ